MPRLFTAIDLPESQYRQISVLHGGLPGARWTPMTQLHLTLRFIGDTDDTLFQAIKAGLAGLTFAPFLIKIVGLGSFPARHHPNILWLGLEDNPELVDLRNRLEKRLIALGLEPEPRKFHPHITIARISAQNTTVADYLARNDQFNTDPFLVDQFRLYTSVLTRNGAVHQISATYHARGAGISHE